MKIKLRLDKQKIINNYEIFKYEAEKPSYEFSYERAVELISQPEERGTLVEIARISTSGC